MEKKASRTTHKAMRPPLGTWISPGWQHSYAVDKPQKTWATTVAHSAVSFCFERAGTHQTATPISTAESQVKLRACVTLLLSVSGCSLLNGRCCAPTSPSARGLHPSALTGPGNVCTKKVSFTWCTNMVSYGLLFIYLDAHPGTRYQL